ncbi:PP_RS20740 family protein [Duganella sp. PWIR1]
MNDQVQQPNDEQNEMAAIFGQDASYAPKGHKKPKEFSAWHRPRKQFVREEQWCSAISTLIESIDFDERSLRYIGLPGNELFDLRTIHELICKPNNLRMRFLGFNNASGVEDDDGFELELSTVEVKELDRVDGQSKVMPDDFRSLGTKNSMAWSNARKFGHFDIVNVDLCDGLFTSKPGVTSDSYYNAIKELVNLQDGRGEPWLLFLTTRVGIKDVHPNTVEILKNAINHNLAQCQSFAQSAKKHLGFGDVEAAAELFKDAKGFSNLFSAGISKWLISLGLSSTPKWKVSLQTVCHYTVYPEATYPDLLSLAFEFTPIKISAEDNFGLVAKVKGKQAKIPTECDLATEIVPFISNVLDVDAHLQSDAALAEKYVERSAALFAKARYPSDQYKAWLKENNY